MNKPLQSRPCPFPRPNRDRNLQKTLAYVALYSGLILVLVGLIAAVSSAYGVLAETMTVVWLALSIALGFFALLIVIDRIESCYFSLNCCVVGYLGMTSGLVVGANLGGAFGAGLGIVAGSWSFIAIAAAVAALQRLIEQSFDD